MAKYALGLDYGTESVRAVLVDVADGAVVATAVESYADGVIDRQLPGTGERLPPDWALQNPQDWLDGLHATTRGVMQTSGVAPDDVIGIGLDFTACTVLPTDAAGTPLCAMDQYRSRPLAWPMLWKHHGAQPQADRVNALAELQHAPWLARYGGAISSEWALPKGMQLLEQAPDLYEAAATIAEAGDWVVWQLTGTLARNACAAGYKGLWHKGDGFPNTAFLAALDPALVSLYRDKFAGPVVAPGHPVGTLNAAWAERLGLAVGIPVAAALIDAHAGVIGGGISEPGTMFLAMGTSTCHMLMDRREVLAEGMAGVVEDGIVPGLFGYEAGQSGVGDIFAWFVDHGVPLEYHQQAANKGVSLHELLSGRAAMLRPGESGLLALDWWSGNRSTLMDADLSGMIIGYSTATTPEAIYRTLIESTAFGTRMIIEAFTSQGLDVPSLLAGGGLTKNPLLMQIYADVTGRPIAVSGAEQAAALGAAMLGAVAAGPERGGYATLPEAVAAMAAPPTTVYEPISTHRAPYDTLYAEYRRLYDYFGRGDNNVMKVLRRLRAG